jgi:outer membrane protein OmpA-like peptidoglycan-associated protein
MPRLALALLLLSTPAVADPAMGNIELDAFRPAMDSRGYLTVNASQTLGDKEVSFGLGALDWGHHLLSFQSGNNTYTIDDSVTATLVGAFGLHLGKLELEFGASLPFSITSGDRGPDFIDAGDPNNNQSYKIDGQGIGNLGLHFKTRFLKITKPPHVGLGVMASVYLPTTDPTNHFLGDAMPAANKVVPQLIGILDKDFGRVRMSLNGGIRYRSTETFTNDDMTNGAPATNQTITASTEIPFGFGVSYAVKKDKFDLVGEVFGAIPLGEHQNYQPLEALGGVKLYLAKNSFLSLGAGRGLIPDKGANPDFRAFIGIVFEPHVGDRDGDGIPDDVDKCPDQPEDFDGFEDEDGCPDPDNDHDGIPDEDDKCPNIPGPPPDGCPIHATNDRDGDGIPDDLDKCPDEPEDFDGFEDADGCPDPDNDKDGIPDVDDLCPNDPEDFDGFQDADGCPDPDNDHDGIPDKLDRCPNEPENFNGVEDADGCPDKDGPVIVGTGVLTTLDPIQFEFDKAIIKPESFHTLDAVVATMIGNPSFKLFEVQGHTDERGDDNYNLDLSIRRAAAVMKYLIDHKVDPARLTSQGYGETQPKDRGHNEHAWYVNRRVEFVILKRDTD